MSRSAAIVIRSHGEIPVQWVDEKAIHDIVSLINYKSYNLDKLNIISISNLGGVCFGNPKVDKWMLQINTLKKNNELSLGIMNTQDFIRALFGDDVNGKIVKINNKLFGNSVVPMITSVPTTTINKLYTPYDPNSGVFLLHSMGFDDDERRELKKTLSDLTYQLNNNGITRQNILESLKKFNIFELFLCDFTCDGYSIQPHQRPLNISQVNWINDQFKHFIIRGGENKSNKTKKYKKRKYKKSPRHMK